MNLDEDQGSLSQGPNDRAKLTSNGRGAAVVSDQKLTLQNAAQWRVRFSKGQIIYDEGEPSRAMYRIERGCVRLQVNGHGGDRQIVSFLFPGDVFGFSVHDRLVSAEAATDVTLTRYSIKSVLATESRSPEITVELIEQVNTLYADLAHHVATITHLPAVERVIWFFQWLLAHKSVGTDTSLLMTPMSQKDIADYLGLKPETLSRAFATLESDGYLQRKSRGAFVLKGPMLRMRLESAERQRSLAEQHALPAQDTSNEDSARI